LLTYLTSEATFCTATSLATILLVVVS
jgi:hypothetical protein